MNLVNIHSSKSEILISLFIREALKISGNFIELFDNVLVEHDEEVYDDYHCEMAVISIQ